MHLTSSRSCPGRRLTKTWSSCSRRRARSTTPRCSTRPAAPRASASCSSRPSKSPRPPSPSSRATSMVVGPSTSRCVASLVLWSKLRRRQFNARYRDFVANPVTQGASGFPRVCPAEIEWQAAIQRLNKLKMATTSLWKPPPELCAAVHFEKGKGDEAIPSTDASCTETKSSLVAQLAAHTRAVVDSIRIACWSSLHWRRAKQAVSRNLSRFVGQSRSLIASPVARCKVSPLTVTVYGGLDLDIQFSPTRLGSTPSFCSELLPSSAHSPLTCRLWQRHLACGRRELAPSWKKTVAVQQRICCEAPDRCV
jgi:hypothetical protein